MTYKEFEKRERMAEKIAELAYEYGIDEQRNLDVLTSLMFAQLSIVVPSYFDETGEWYDGDNDGYDEDNQEEIESMMTEADNFPYPREVRDELAMDLYRRERDKIKTFEKANRKIDRILAKAR